VYDDDLPLPALAVIVLCVGAAIVLSTWMTIIAFIGGTMPIIGWETDGGITTGLVWLFVVDPLIVTVCAWVTMLVTAPIALLRRRRAEAPASPHDDTTRG
jgi:hypothetical protein